MQLDCCIRALLYGHDNRYCFSFVCIYGHINKDIFFVLMSTRKTKPAYQEREPTGCLCYYAISVYAGRDECRKQ